MAGNKEGEMIAGQPDQSMPKALGTVSARREDGRIVAEFVPNGSFVIVNRWNGTALGEVTDAAGTKRLALMEIRHTPPTEPSI